MPKQVITLTDVAIRRAKPKEKSYKLADGRGLYLEVMPSGSKKWRLKYRRPDGRENRLSFGAYPEVSLAGARERATAARAIIAEGRDPADEAKRLARESARTSARTFEVVAREWHATMLDQWQPQTARDILHRFEIDIFPEIGHLPLNGLHPQDVLAAIRKIEGRGALEIAKRNLANCSRVFVYGFHCRYIDQNPAAMLHKVLKPRQEGHFGAIAPDDLPEFLEKLNSNDARMKRPTSIAMRLMLLVFVRTSELIETTWDEIPIDTFEWVIPWWRMKSGKRRRKPSKLDHQVCPSRQARELLRELHGLTGGGKFLFPNEWDPNRPMSNNAILKVLERMGYKHAMTGHGFRALAMTTLKERLNYRHEVVDRQLAHAQSDKLESAYDRGQYLAERRQMMQVWADYLDSLA